VSKTGFVTWCVWALRISDFYYNLGEDFHHHLDCLVDRQGMGAFLHQVGMGGTQLGQGFHLPKILDGSRHELLQLLGSQ